MIDQLDSPILLATASEARGREEKKTRTLPKHSILVSTPRAAVIESFIEPNVVHASIWPK